MKYLAPILLAISLLFATPSPAQHRHPPEHAALHDQFYKTWTMPHNRAISCCHDEDCKPAQSKLVDGSWYARHTDDDPWTKIPAERVEHERDSPDGRSHLCGRKYGFSGNPEFTVFCFLPAGGS